MTLSGTAAAAATNTRVVARLGNKLTKTPAFVSVWREKEKKFVSSSLYICSTKDNGTDKQLVGLPQSHRFEPKAAAFVFGAFSGRMDGRTMGSSCALRKPAIASGES